MPAARGAQEGEARTQQEKRGGLRDGENRLSGGRVDPRQEGYEGESSRSSLHAALLSTTNCAEAEPNLGKPWKAPWESRKSSKIAARRADTESLANPRLGISITPVHAPFVGER
jgi:hypothetical protein